MPRSTTSGRRPHLSSATDTLLLVVLAVPVLVALVLLAFG